MFVGGIIKLYSNLGIIQAVFIFVLDFIITYVFSTAKAAVLYCLCRYVVKHKLNFATCFKLILIFMILDLMFGVVSLLASFIPISIDAVFVVLGLCKLVYSYIIFTYYLKAIYNYQNKQAGIILAVFVVWDIILIVANSILVS